MSRSIKPTTPRDDASGVNYIELYDLHKYTKRKPWREGPEHYRFACPPKYWRKVFGIQKARAAERRLEYLARIDPDSPIVEREVPNAWKETEVAWYF